MTHESKHLFIAAAAVVLVLNVAGAPTAAADVAASQPATQPDAALPPKTLKAMKALLAKAELIVLGKVAAVSDRTARDAGMVYDVNVNKVLKGKWEKKSLSFRSTGWVGYAKYTKGQRVLLFLRRWGDKQDELLQLKPVVYISPPQPGGLDLRPVEKYLKLIKSLQPGGDKAPMRAGDRAKLLKQHVDKFSLTLKHINPNGPNIRPVVWLTVAEMGGRVRSWRISKAQAVKLIDHLAAEGFLESSRDIFVTKAPEIAGPCCVLSVGGLPGVSLEENLGWNLKMLGRLDALRKVLDGKAAKAVAEFIKALEPQRKNWRKEAAATQPGKTKPTTRKAIGGPASAPAPATKGTAERAKLLRKGVDSFWLTLRWHTTQGKLLSPGQSLQLTTVEGDYDATPFFATVVITKQRAGKIIAYLAAEGFLDRASDVKDAKSYPVPKLKSYSLTVRTTFGPHLYEHMPWGLNLLKRVEGLRKVMADNREAVKVIDKILAPLKTIPTAGAARPDKAPRDVKVRQVCMAALRKMQKDFAALATRYPKELGGLGPPAIDEKKLLLRFPVKNLPKAAPATRPAAGRSRLLPLQPGDCGLLFRFTAPIPPKVGACRWLHLNVSFAWWWMWPNRPFSWKAQQDLMKMVNKALVPLNELENTMVAADLVKRQKGSYVLRGRAGVKLTIQRSPKRDVGGTFVDLYATNETKGVLALYPPFTQIIGDGKPWHYHAPGSVSMVNYVFGSDNDPFMYIKPGQRAKVGAAVVAGLSVGRHTVRVAAGHPCDYWVDMRPTFHDGSPVARKIPGAWTGVLVSGEMTIDIPTPAAAKKKAAERAKLLKKNTGTLYLILQYHLGYIGAKPSLHLATGVYKIELIGGLLARLTPKEAANIIDHLAKEGFLAQAENVVGKDITPPQGPAYTLTLMGAGQTRLYQVFGWDLKMLRRLDALRKALDKGSDAGKAMDKVLKALAPQRKKWRARAPRDDKSTIPTASGPGRLTVGR